MKPKTIVTLLAVAVMATFLPYPALTVTSVPAVKSTKEAAPLFERKDAALQRALESELRKRPKWQQLVRQNRMAVGLVDLNGTPRFASINGNRMMYAASLPKIAVLLAAYVSFEKGTLEETPEVHDDLADMIRYSSNAAATRMMDRIGMRQIGNILSDPAYRLYDKQRGGGLWVGKRYASDGARLGDPLHGISHGATANQVCRFYYLLDTGGIISPERSAQMLSDLSDPGLHHKFVHALNQRAPDAQLYRKSGTWRNYHADSVLVRGPDWRNYILTAMVQSDEGEQILKDLVPLAESLIYPVATLAAPSPTL